ncbi:MAG: hypothetical protein LBU51_03630, partial [Bacteroidales bacterium]|nr:hypothetical protein [Bacteroidales bacterium]
MIGESMALDANLKLRYFLNSNVALRLKLGVYTGHEKEKVIGTFDDMYSQSTYSEGAFQFGAEYHFKGTKRLSPHVGGELGLAYAFRE